jgi:DNA-binding transcriptional ArsR family regulator
MESKTAIEAFSALAQPTRLAALKLLVRAGPNGVAAGEIARAVDAPASTMSAHLGALARAGLVVARRDSRMIYYAADMGGLAALVSYLIEDCCEGHPEICVPVAAAVQRASCCAPANSDTAPAKKGKRT